MKKELDICPAVRYIDAGRFVVAPRVKKIVALNRSYLVSGLNHFPRSPMKSLALLLSLCAATFLVSCNSTTTNTPSLSCILTKAIRVVTDSLGSHTDSTIYAYNTSNQVTTVTNGSDHSTLTYSGGMLDMRMDYSGGSTTANRTYTYTWSGSYLTKIVETGTNNSTPYTSTTTISWSGSAVSSITQTGNPNGNVSVTNIVMSGGDVTSADVDPVGGGALTTIHLTVACDGKKNNSRFVIPNDFVLPFFCTNNIVSATATNTITLGPTTIHAGDKILNATFTYTSEGEVATQSNAATVFDKNPSVTTNSYDCK